MSPIAAATYERARRLANISLWTIKLQHRRIHEPDLADSTFPARKFADFDFLIVALTRLRRAATLAAGIPEIKASISAALKEFDAALPHLKKMRDVAEHIDDYAVDQGREPNVQRQALETSLLTMDNSSLTLTWLDNDHKLNASEALKASQKLFDAIKVAAATFRS